MEKRFNNLKIGILGGGQLGRMLLQKAADFSLNIKVLDPDPAAPCRHLAEEFVNGSFLDHDTVYSFGKSCDLLTIEIEHVNVEALERLEKEGVKVYPQPSIIRLVQDKGNQKTFFRENGFPTSDFQIIENRAALNQLNLKFPVMQKLRKGGYDGKGVFRIDKSDQIKNGFDSPSVVEKLISFRKEIAVIVARNQSGCKSFPAVEMEFNPEANLVEFLYSPADLLPQEELKAQKLAMDIANALDITGILAVEMFLTDSDIIVNEIAPRPHNSGHHTIEGNETSQYEQHLRAILNLPLGSTEQVLPSVMVNLLGEKNHEGYAVYKGLEAALDIEGVHLHLYGKKLTKPFRKMGHVTITDSNLNNAKAKALKIKNLIKVISE